MAFQNAIEFHGFGNLVIWLWKNFGNFFKTFVRTPGRGKRPLISSESFLSESFLVVEW